MNVEDIAPRSRTPRRMTSAAAKRIATLYGRGKSIRAIAAEVDYSYGAVRNVLVGSGTELRRRGRARVE
jgi:transposase